MHFVIITSRTIQVITYVKINRPSAMILVEGKLNSEVNGGFLWCAHHDRQADQQDPDVRDRERAGGKQKYILYIDI